MPRAVPAIDTLIMDIRLRISNGPISEHEMAQFKSRAKKLIKADAAQAYCALGVIYSVEGKEKLARENYNKAIQVSNPLEQTQVLFNFGISLINLDNYEEGAAIILEVINTDKRNLNYLNEFIQIMYNHGDTRLAELLATWEKLTNGEPHPLVAEMDQELTQFCMISSQSALADIWDTPEEDEAWKHLQ